MRKLQRFVMTDLPQEMAELQAALEADMALPSIAKESYHHQQAANLETMKLLMDLGVKLLVDGPVAEPAVSTANNRG